ncbi:MAG: ATP-binding protein [Pseudomonadota bacterium]
MLIENQKKEFKDFGKCKNSDKKKVISILFKEITAFSNTEGGEIIVGVEDKSKTQIVQPDFVYSWLENDRLTSLINNLSDSLVVFNSYREGNLVHIKVPISTDIISVGRDTTGLNKGECFIRENGHTVKATGKRLIALAREKSGSIDEKLKRLRIIVHHKFQNGENDAQKFNIFDSLFVSLNNKYPYINTVFDFLKMSEFIYGYRLPISKHSTQQLHIELAAIASKKSVYAQFKSTFEQLMKSDHSREMFFEAHRNEIIESEQLKSYLLEYNHLFED